VTLQEAKPLDAGDFQVDRSGPCHILEAETMGLTLLPVHFPQKALQIPLFEAVLADTPSLLERQCLLLGDMNCGTSHCQYVHEVREKGLSDHSALIVDVSI